MNDRSKLGSHGDSYVYYNPDMVIRFDRRGIILESNPAAVSVLGPQVAKGRPINEALRALGGVDFRRCIERDELLRIKLNLSGQIYQFALRGISELGVGNAYGSEVTELEAALRQL